MSNRRKRHKRLERFGIKRAALKPPVCEACARGELPGYEHTMNGMPIITPADIQRMRAGLS
jgi:hypothetical protein